MIQVKIIRHSERLDYSKPLTWAVSFGHYWADSPLTSNGHTMAYQKGKQLASENFNPKYIYTSPYIRTMATATEINSSFPTSKIIIEPLLSEYQPSNKHFINLYPNGIPTTFEGQVTDFVYPETAPENFDRRVKFIISKLIERNNEDILIITHGEVLKTYITYLQSLFPELMLDPGTTPYLTTLSFTYDKEGKRIIESSVKLD